jgi:hypothetical protein
MSNNNSSSSSSSNQQIIISYIDYLTIKKKLQDKNSYYSDIEMNYLLRKENENELEDIIFQIYSHFLKYKEERKNDADKFLNLLSDFLNGGNFFDYQYIWSSFYIEKEYFNKNKDFPKDFFNRKIKDIYELLDIFILKKIANPYSFVLSDKAFNIMSDYVYYTHNIFEENSDSNIESKIEKLNKLKFSNNLLLSFQDAEINKELDFLIKNYLHTI